MRCHADTEDEDAHDEYCQGRLSDLDPDDSTYEDGMMLDCCKEPIQSKTCEGGTRYLTRFNH